MELKSLTKKLPAVISKYRFVILVLLIGIVLMILPSVSDNTEKEVTARQEVVVPQTSLEEELSQILCQVDGAGRVQVLLTTGEGAETVYQTDTDLSSDGTGSHTTVTVTDAERTQTGLIQKVNPPIYLGAVVVCQGADDPTVRLAIIEAVSNATGLGTHCISVLKMK